MAGFTNSALAAWLATCTLVVPTSPAKPSPVGDGPHVDRYGDQLPPGAVARLGTLRFRHDGPVQDITYAPDGTTIATIDRHTLYLWEPATGRERRRQDGVTEGGGLALSPDGESLATSVAGAITVWNMATGNRLRRFPAPGELPKALKFSNDGKMLAWLTQDNDLCVSDAGTGKLLQRWPGPAGYRTPQVAFFPDSRTIAFGSPKYTYVPVYDIRTGKEVRRFAGHNGFVSCMALSADGRILASGARDDTLRLWDAATGRQLHEVKGTGPLQTLLFSPDGSALASAGHDIRFWEAGTGRLLRACEGGQEGYDGALAFSPDSRSLCGCEDQTICFWDVRSGKKRLVGAGHHGQVQGVAVARDGRLVASTGDAVCLWDPVTGQLAGTLGSNLGFVAGPGFSPDGRYVAAGDVDGTVTIWDPSSRCELRRLNAHNGRVGWVGFAADSKTLASLGAYDGTIRVWDVTAGRQLHAIPGNQPLGGGQAALVPDGKIVVQGGDARPWLVLWDVDSGKRMDRFGNVAGPVMGIALSPDGRILACATFPGSLRLWDIASGRQVRSLPCPVPAIPLAFSADGRILATSGTDKSVRLWEVATGLERCRFTGDRGGARVGAFSRDGRVFFSGGLDTAVLVWDVTGRVTKPGLEAIPASVPDLDQQFSDLSAPDGSRAHRAIWTLVAAPGQAVRLLEKRLEPIVAADPARVARLVADLNHPSFAIRDRATKDLQELGESAILGLQKALAGLPSPEVRQRLEQLMDRLAHGSPQQWRAWRALETLEHVGTPEAYHLVEKLARGMPEARLTQEARSTLERLGVSPRR
jgi:WD40 repeat protein